MADRGSRSKTAEPTECKLAWFVVFLGYFLCGLHCPPRALGVELVMLVRLSAWVADALQGGLRMTTFVALKYIYVQKYFNRLPIAL